MRILAVLVAGVLLAAAPAAAQIENCASYARIIDDIVAGADVQRATIALVDVEQTNRCFALYAAGVDEVNRNVFDEFVRRFEASRTDEQSGSGPGASGSTSVVANGPAARVLSVAAEYGALTQSVSGQVVTVRGNLAGLPAALVREDVFPYCVGSDSTSGFCVSGSLLGLLRRVSFGVSFDATRGNQVTAVPGAPEPGEAQPVIFSATRTALSAASARIELWNGRDVTSQAFIQEWRAKVGAAMNDATRDLAATAGEFAIRVTETEGYEPWRQRSLALVRAAGQDRARIVAALNAALADLVTLLRGTLPTFQADASAALAAYNRYFIAQDELLDSLATKKVLALEYTNNHPIGQPRTSNIRLVLDWPMSRRTRVVANGAVTLYDDSPVEASGASRYRDAQVGIQLDHGVGDYSILGPATVSLAAYFQYQHSPVLLDIDPANPIPGVSFVDLPEGAATVFTNTGSIGLFQVKLALAPPGSSMKIPVAVTYSNRTELIDKPAWRAQVGVTYDFDSLFAGFASR